MPMHIAAIQFNALVGDIAGNVDRMIGHVRAARARGASVVVFPEQAIVGYPVLDLIFVSGFVDKNLAALRKIKEESKGITIITGFIDRDEHDARKLYNAAAIIQDGAIVASVRKQLLPTYDVFDEARYFKPGTPSTPVRIYGIDTGIAICEDAWDDDYDVKVIDDLVRKGARAIISINASPYHAGKLAARERVIRAKATRLGVPVVYVNMVGGQDEITFDGYSFAMNPDGVVAFRAPPFTEGIHLVGLDAATGRVRPGGVAPAPPVEQEIFMALSLNLRDYFEKSRVFKKILVGLSGGIDSAFTAAVACDAVGPSNVTCLYLPTRFNIDESRTNSKLLCDNLGCEFIEFPIDAIFECYEGRLLAAIPGKGFDVSDENLQSRIRGAVLMYFSNALDYLLVSTGNKSEISTGYCTLYGDTCGGKNVPGDIYKTQLVKICTDFINKDKEIIPRFIITRPPSAELRENQKDEDSLPPYDTLDRILAPMIEEQRCVDDILAMGFDEATVRRVQRLVKNSEFKRAQLVQTIKITPKSFGMGRKMPVTNGYDYSGGCDRP